MEKDGTKRARHYTLLTGNAPFFINLTISIFSYNSICRAIFPALGFFTLFADNGHPDDRMRINDYHPDATLFWIIDSEPVDGTDYLTEPTTRAPLRNYSQSSRQKIPPHHFL